MCDEKRASEVGQLCARPGGGMEDGVGAGVQSAEGGWSGARHAVDGRAGGRVSALGPAPPLRV